MNEELKRLLATLRIDGNLRMRLNKIFDSEEPVTSIDLRGTEHGKKLEVFKEDLPPLLSICEKIPNLQIFIIIGPSLDDESISMIASFLSNKLELKVLHVESNQVSAGGFACIAKSVQMLPNLFAVYLQGDMLNDNAVESITQALLMNTHIYRLSIEGGKEISDAGIAMLSKLISMNRLDQIAITCHYLSIDSCKRLGQLIAQNTKLRGLVIEANTIDGLKFLLDGIRINSFLTDILLMSHNLDTSGETTIAEEIEKIIDRNKQGFWQRSIEKVLEQMHAELRLQTHLYDRLFSEKFMATAKICTDSKFQSIMEATQEVEQQYSALTKRPQSGLFT